MTIFFRVLATFEDAEIVREIRNEARQWMGSQELLSRADQLRWFDRISQLSPRDFYCGLADEPPSGYGTVERRSDGRLWITLAVRETARGRGTGTRIYAEMTSRAREPIYAGIRRDNTASMRAAEKAGYRLVIGICPPDISEAETAQWIVLSSPP
jgi:RimJ/RimL family protein N-acetyltransferase